MWVFMSTKLAVLLCDIAMYSTVQSLHNVPIGVTVAITWRQTQHFKINYKNL